jgi:endoglucanase
VIRRPSARIGSAQRSDADTSSVGAHGKKPPGAPSVTKRKDALGAPGYAFGTMKRPSAPLTSWIVGMGLVQVLGSAGCSESARGDSPAESGGGRPSADGGAAGTPASVSGTTGASVAAGTGSGAGPNTAGAATGGISGSGGPSTAGAGPAGGAGGGSPLGDPFVPGVAPAAAAHFKKGINLGNRLEAPNEGDWGGVIHAEDFAFIAQRGFDHVRIPVRFSGHALAAAPYTIDTAFFSRVDAVLEQARAAGLSVVLDMHAYDELALDVASQRDRFLSLWAQIASHYQSLPDTLAFELLNEPYSQLDAAWNDLVVAALGAIRPTNPRRLVIVDSVFWADPTKLALLRLPNDANIMASIHFYEPKLFTFQGMEWMGPPYMTTGVTFPGPPATPIVPVAAATETAWANRWFMDYNTKPAATNPSGPATIAAQLALITAYQKAQGRVVYNGEWGPQQGGALDSRVRLVTMVREECEKAGIGWAIWEDPEHMHLFDSSAGTWVAEIVDALLPP